MGKDGIVSFVRACRLYWSWQGVGAQPDSVFRALSSRGRGQRGFHSACMPQIVTAFRRHLDAEMAHACYCACGSSD